MCQESCEDNSVFQQWLGGYYIPRAMAFDVLAALDGWKDYDFLRAQFPTLASYAPVSALIIVNHKRLTKVWGS
jgi:hypothetical protein